MTDREAKIRSAVAVWWHSYVENLTTRVRRSWEALLLNLDVLITALATISGVFAGTFAGLVSEKRKRFHDLSVSLRNEKKDVYARFLSTVVQWQNAISWRWELRFVQPGTEADLQLASRRVEEAHQSAMPPLFELRMVGSAEVIAAAEAIMQFVYLYEKEYEQQSVDEEDMEKMWITRRDTLINRARNEIVGMVKA
jgi:hypothetical protein